MSSGIEACRTEYYQQLESAQRGSLDITAWLAWFLDCLEHTLDDAGAVLQTVLAKARVLERVGAEPVSDRQRLVIRHMLDSSDAAMTTSKLWAATGASASGRKTASARATASEERNMSVDSEGSGREDDRKENVRRSVTIMVDRLTGDPHLGFDP